MRLIIIIWLFGTISNFALAHNLITPDGYVDSEDMPLRLRVGPGLSYDVIDLLPDGTPLSIIGRTANNEWLEIRTLDQYRLGWVYSAYVDIAINLNNLPDHSGQFSYPDLISGITNRTRDIYRYGQQMGNRPGVFAKVGDSITVSRHALYPIGLGQYHLDTFDYLQPAIDYFSSEVVREANAFTNTSVAAGVGWNAAAALLTSYTDPKQCEADETPLLCEYRTLRPAFALIMFGTNDVGYIPANVYQHNLTNIIETSINWGIIPVVSTIPPRIGYEPEVIEFNRIVRTLAQQYEIPLWDYGYAMAVYRQSSLDLDGVHPSLPPHGHDEVANFRAENLYYGYVIRNLSALHVLDALWQEVILEVEQHM